MGLVPGGDAMRVIEDRDHDERGPGPRGPSRRGPGPAPPWPSPYRWGPAAFVLAALGLATTVVFYNACKIEVRSGEQAVLIRRAGLDLGRDMELAPPRKD